MDRKKLLQLVVIFGGLLLGILATYIIYNSLTLRVVSVSPSPNNFPNSSFFVDVNFNKPIAKQDIVIDPNIVQTTEVSGKRVRVVLKITDIKLQKYTLTIKSAATASNKTVQNKKIVLDVKNIPFDKLPKGLQKELLDYQDKHKIEAQDPIMQYLPHETINYSIRPKITDDEEGGLITVITIRLLLSAREASGTNQDVYYKQYKKQALDYLDSLKSKGIDRTKYDIEYTPVSATKL